MTLAQNPPYNAGFACPCCCSPANPLAPSFMSCLWRSSSCTICSSWKASAYGRPSSSTLVHTTHRPLPPSSTPRDVADVTDEVTLAMRARVAGGTISRSAAMRSNSVSSREDETAPRSEASEISESVWLVLDGVIVSFVSKGTVCHVLWGMGEILWKERDEDNEEIPSWHFPPKSEARW